MSDSLSDSRDHDPRSHVTPDAFHVADAMLGLPLAAPWRRLGALLVDLVLIGALSLSGGVALSVVLAGLLFALIVRRPATSLLWRLTRGCFALVVAFLVLLFLVGTIFVSDLEKLAGDDWVGFSENLQEITSEMSSGDPAKAQEAALRMELEMLLRFTEELDDPRILEELIAEAGVDSETVRLVFEEYGLAVPGDETDPAAIEARRISRLTASVRRLTQENLEMREEIDNPSLRRLAGAIAADLGLTVGWSGVYFTLFLAFWGGRTPGKRLFRLRVLRLDDRPIGIWGAFERAAGYAAGLATGMLGFLQIFWDPNRQAVHDKIVGTVVVQD